MRGRSAGPPGAPHTALPDVQKPARLLVGLRTHLYDLHLPSALVFRNSVPHLLITQVFALVRVMSPGLLVHLPASPSWPADQSAITAASLPEAAWELSNLVNQVLLTGLRPGRQAAPDLRSGQAPPLALHAGRAHAIDRQPGMTARAELACAVNACVRGTLHLDDLTVQRLPRAELASEAYDAAARLKHLIAAIGPTSVMPVNPWVAMAELADGTTALTDGVCVCWDGARRSATGRALITYTGSWSYPAGNSR